MNRIDASSERQCQILLFPLILSKLTLQISSGHLPSSLGWKNRFTPLRVTWWASGQRPECERPTARPFAR